MKNDWIIETYKTQQIIANKSASVLNVWAAKEVWFPKVVFYLQLNHVLYKGNSIGFETINFDVIIDNEQEIIQNWLRKLLPKTKV